MPECLALMLPDSSTDIMEYRLDGWPLGSGI